MTVNAPMRDEHLDPQLHRESATFSTVSRVMISAERAVFVLVGALLFVAALGLAWRSIGSIAALFAGTDTSIIATASHFLDVILLILMIAEIAYTVTLSVRGVVLSPQPFLIVGLIAVIRRILVITVQEVQPTTAMSPLGLVSSSIDVAILTLVVLAFVFSIHLLRERKSKKL